MWSYEAERLVSDEPPAVHAAIAVLVDTLWGDRNRVVHDDGLLHRTDAIAASLDSDEPDVWLTWELSPTSPATTKVRLALHEVEAGPDPTDGLREVLALLDTRVQTTSL